MLQLLVGTHSKTVSGPLKRSTYHRGNVWRHHWSITFVIYSIFQKLSQVVQEVCEFLYSDGLVEDKGYRVEIILYPLLSIFW